MNILSLESGGGGVYVSHFHKYFFSDDDCYIQLQLCIPNQYLICTMYNRNTTITYSIICLFKTHIYIYIYIYMYFVLAMLRFLKKSHLFI